MRRAYHEGTDELVLGKIQPSLASGVNGGWRRGVAGSPALAQRVGLQIRIMLNRSELREALDAAYSRSDHLIDRLAILGRWAGMASMMWLVVATGVVSSRWKLPSASGAPSSPLVRATATA